MSRATWRSLGLFAWLIVSGCASQSSLHKTATVPKGTVAVLFQPGLTIRCLERPDDPKRLFIEVEGFATATLEALRRASIDADTWPEFLALYVDIGSARQDLPPIQGRYELVENRVRFEPQYPMRRGLRYRIRVSPGKVPGQTSLSLLQNSISFFLPAPPRTPKTVVTKVTPTASQLPENLLKFYIHFSGPMIRGGNYDHIHIVDTTGNAVDRPFLELGEELWNPELTRLTVLFDPGRIKRGVLPLEEVGPSIEAGKRYTLVIDAKWLDSDGAPLKATYRKSFNVTPADRVPLEPSNWSIRAPDAGSRGLLVLRFPEPIDDALARRLIWVVDAENRPVLGAISLANEERTWTFLPEKEWAEGRYQIVTDTLIEDVAGNNIGKPFDVDVFDQVEARPSQNTVAIPFEARPR